MTLLSRACVRIGISLKLCMSYTVYKIFSVKELRNLETGDMGRLR